MNINEIRLIENCVSLTTAIICITCIVCYLIYTKSWEDKYWKLRNEYKTQLDLLGEINEIKEKVEEIDNKLRQNS